MANRSGLSLVEVLVCLALLAVVGLPLLTLAGRSRGTVVASRLALLAAHVAREEIEDTRVLAHARPGPLDHDWQPCGVTTVARLGALADRVDGNLPLRYPDDYRRIATRLALKPTRDPRLAAAHLDVRWNDVEEHTAGFDFLVTRGRSK